ncbi:phage late control D family protein [Paenibacillus naphthalenovorans]|uniref:phage late control D family protein n=1 Tax=Paenibacillus naphthalenovorans TaxID=162209 RepID=UPI003D2DFAEE
MLARRANVSVEYAGVDITSEVQADLLSFSYTDNASGDADSISLTLKDERKKWANDWFPEKGDVVTPAIRTTNWRREGDRQELPCGRFFVDEPEYSGHPSVLTIGAISAPLNSNFSSTQRSRTWRNISLSSIARDISSRYGLELQFIGKNNPRYSTIEQTETPDAAYLSELCEKDGLALKVTDQKIVIFDEREFERRDSVATIREWSDIVLRYTFRTSLSNTAYAGVNVKYYDAALGRTIEYQFTIRDPGGKDKIFQLNSKVRTGEEAHRLARRTLRNLNKKEWVGTLGVVGKVNLLGGSCVDLEGFGRFSGKYYIQSATHTVGGGYTTDIEVRKVLEGY